VNFHHGDTEAARRLTENSKDFVGVLFTPSFSHEIPRDGESDTPSPPEFARPGLYGILGGFEVPSVHGPVLLDRFDLPPRPKKLIDPLR
jgi:hypothetical protein